MSITSANSIYQLSVPGVSTGYTKLSGYSADNAFETDALDLTENIMGVDGHMSSGYTPNITKQTITLMADSPSVALFEGWISTIKMTREIVIAQAHIELTTNNLSPYNKKYDLSNGSLKSARTIPGAKKVLEAQEYVIEWESCRLVS